MTWKKTAKRAASAKPVRPAASRANVIKGAIVAASLPLALASMPASTAFALPNQGGGTVASQPAADDTAGAATADGDVSTTNDAATTGDAAVTANTTADDGNDDGSGDDTRRHASAPAGNVTIIVQLDGSNPGLNPFMSLFANTAGNRHDFVRSEIRNLMARTPNLMVDGSADQPVYEELRDYYHAIDGFAVKVPASLLDKIRALPSVKRAFVEHGYSVPSDEGLQDAPKNQTSLDMTGADKVSQKGDGQLIAIVDSGLEVTHESFKGDLADGSVAETEASIEALKGKLGEGKDGRYVSEKIPFVYDYADKDADVDPGGVGGMDHGTHVAGIAAANSGQIRGTAPDAQIAMMKVAQTSDGTIWDSALLAAFDDAVVMAPDTVNVSLGSDAGFADDASAVYGDAIASLEATGATVNVAAGNSYTSAHKNKTGENLPYATDPDSSNISSPSSFSSTVSVASVNNADPSPAFKAADGTAIGYVEASSSSIWAAPPLFSTLNDGMYEYVDAGIGSAADADKLKAAYPDGMDGKMLLVQRGGEDAGEPLTFTQKADNLAALNASAVIFYDNLDTGLTSFVVDNQSVTSVMVTKESGEKLRDAATKTITKDASLTVPTVLANRMSDFSSWGPNTDLTLKPEITAPGGNIYSSVTGGGYDYKSGTSMATPQVAGISALVHQYVDEDAKFSGLSDDEKADRVTQLLMSTANPIVDPMTDTGQTAYYSPRQEGAGLANVPGAVKTPVYLTVEGAADASRPKAELGESAAGSWDFTVVLHNMGDAAQTYAPDAVAMSEQISHGMFLTLDQTWTNEGIDVSFGGDYTDGSVTVPAGGEARLSVHVQVSDAFTSYLAENGATNGAYVEGYARLKATSEDGVDLSVPYLGFYGDWDAQPIFDAPEDSTDPAPHMVGNALMNAATAKNLGTNPLNTSADVDPTKAVVSNSTIADAPAKLTPFTTLMRNARTLSYAYLDANGTQVLGFDYNFIPKTTYSDNATSYLYVEGTYLEGSDPSFAGRDANGNRLPDGTYTLRRTATLASKDARSETLDQSFIYDTQAPVVSNIGLAGEGDAATVTFDVTDASWLAGLNFVAPDGDARDASSYYYQLVVGSDNYDGSSISEPEENADGTRTWHVSIPKSAISDAWGSWKGPGGEVPNTVPVYAWDFGSNVSQRANVVMHPVAATGVTLSATDVALAPGQTGALTATVVPDTATQTDLVWASSDEGIVKVDEKGGLTGVAEGTATVTVSVRENPAVQATAQVRVAAIDDATGIALSQDAASLVPNQQLTVTALVADSYAGNVTWASSDDSIVSVQQADGKLKQVSRTATLVAHDKVGEVTVTATATNAAGDTKSASMTVRVYPDDYTDFVIDDNHVLTAYKGSKSDVSIPSDVTEIADAVFSGSSIRSVQIPAGVTKIGAQAFKSAHNLQTVTFAEGSQLASVGDQAFYGTQGLEALDLPVGVTSLGDEVLSTSSVARVTLPASLTSIPVSAFENDINLADLTVGNGVTEIGAHAFDACSALTTIKLVGDGAVDGATGLPAALETIGEGAFSGSHLVAAVFPSGVRTVGAKAFENAWVTNLMLNEGLESIGDGAFGGARAASLVIPDSVTTIGAGAFTNMGQLATVRVGAGVPAGTLVGAFAGDTSLVAFSVADGAAYKVDDGVLLSADTTELVAYPAAKTAQGGVYAVPDGVAKIDDSAFASTVGVSQVTFPDSLRTIGTAAFSGSALTSVTLPDAVETVGERAFADSGNLAYANVGGATELGDKAFSRCPALATVDLREDLNRLASIGAYAFSDDTQPDESIDGSGPKPIYDAGLTELSLPDSVTTIGKGAFANLTGLVRIHLGAGVTTGGEGLFDGTTALAELTVSPKNTVYSALDNVLYAQQSDGLHLVKSAPASAVTDVTVQSGTVAIDDAAFRNNRLVRRVVLPEGLISIGMDAFNTCDSLEEVIFPDSLETLGAAAFNWDLKLDYVEFGTKIKMMGDAEDAGVFSGRLPTHMIVRGGQDGTYVASVVQDPNIQETAYFGPGMKNLIFGGSGTLPKTMVVPADLEKIEMPWYIGSYASQVVVYAPEGSAGWDVAKAALESAKLDTSVQLRPYTQLGVTLAADGTIEPGAQVTLTATGVGGAVGNGSALQYRFVQVAADGSETVLQDWSAANTLAWTVPTDGALPVVEVRDDVLLTERAALGFEVLPTVSLDASGEVVVPAGAAMPMLTASVTAPEGAKVSYQWFRDGAAIDGATGASYVPVDDGNGASSSHAYHVVATVVAADGSATVRVTSDDVTVRVVGKEPVSTDALAAAVEAAGQLAEGDYTPESWKAFADALAAARDALTAAESQDAVDAALGRLEGARAGLVKVTPAPEVKVDALAAEVDAASQLAEGDYTPESWKAFAAALENARTVLAAPVSQDAVDAALASLQSARDALVKDGEQPGGGDGGQQPGGGENPGGGQQPGGGDGGQQPGGGENPGGGQQPGGGGNGGQGGQQPGGSGGNGGANNGGGAGNGGTTGNGNASTTGKGGSNGTGGKQLPQTSDPISVAAMAGTGIVGSIAAMLGIHLRRRK